jgi:regulator of protease activity HflC (stomatin/prohibitin superfamily)
MRVEDQLVTGAMEVTEDQVGTWMAENETNITRAKAEREAAERRAKGEFSMDDELAARRAEEAVAADADA